MCDAGQSLGASINVMTFILNHFPTWRHNTNIVFICTYTTVQLFVRCCRRRRRRIAWNELSMSGFNFNINVTFSLFDVLTFCCGIVIQNKKKNCGIESMSTNIQYPLPLVEGAYTYKF